MAGGGGGGAGGQYSGGGAGGNADSDGTGGGADYTFTGGFFPGGFGGQSGDSGGGAGTTVDSIYLNRNGTLTLQTKVTSPGQVKVLMTAWKNNIATMARVLNPAPRRLVYGRATATATRPGTLTIHVMPNRTGRRLLARPAYRVTLRVRASYIPLYASQTDTGYYGLNLGGACPGCQRRVWP